MERQLDLFDEALGARLQRLSAAGSLRALDCHFAQWMGTIEGTDSPGLMMAAWLVSRQAGDGDVCVDLARFADAELPGLGVRAPALAPWRDELGRSKVVGAPGDYTPLVLEGGQRLYLRRLHRAESFLADDLAARAAAAPPGLDRQRLLAGLEALFPLTDGAVDWQRVAAATAVLRGFTVISGGPGTGKTHTVAAILALLQAQTGAGRLRIGLAAPTGKAAARLSESIRQAGARLGSAWTGGGLEAVTLHRLLGARPRRGFLRGATNPLHLDLLVVDEASMVALPMMAQLAAALPSPTRLILLGDKDQLASVEAGSVLADICGGGGQPRVSAPLAAELAQLGMTGLPAATGMLPPIADSIALLRRSYRFGPDSGIGALAAAVNAGDARRARALLDDPRRGDLGWSSPTLDALDDVLREQLVRPLRELVALRDPAAALAAWRRFRVLCALRRGPWGAQQLNRRIEQALIAAGAIPPGRQWYAGRPIMVTRNEPSLELANGDVGLLLPAPERGAMAAQADAPERLLAWFEGADGQPRALSPARLPPSESVYAMTVHKSQGSEFDRVLVVLPGEDAAVLSRELIYTAITRARSELQLWSGPAVLEAAIGRRVQRSGGLLRKLWDCKESVEF